MSREIQELIAAFLHGRILITHPHAIRWAKDLRLGTCPMQTIGTVSME
jgi:hypothetical protein